MIERRFLSAFRAPSTRRLFSWLVILVSAALFMLRSFLDDFYFSKIIGEILESLLATFIAALGIAAFLRFFVPRDVDREILLLEPRDLRDEFNTLLQTSESWKYKGNFGRYFRTSVLSSLSSRSVEKHIAIEVECIVIDPDNKELCKLHADARNSVRTVDGKRDWVERDVRIEVYATIVCCFIYRKTINLRLGLINYFEPQRFDISSSAIIITREDNQAPAVKINKDSYLFFAIRRDYQTAMSQCRDIKLTVNSLSLDRLDSQLAKQILIDAGLDKSFIDSDIEAICAKALEKSNPYVRFW